MATSRNPHTPHRRPPVSDPATGAATPPDTDATPDNPHENTPGHPNARGTLPTAIRLPNPVTATTSQPLSPVEHDDSAARQHRAATAARDVDEPDIDTALDAVVAAAPPQPYEVRARLAWLLRGRRHEPHGDKAA